MFQSFFVDGMYDTSTNEWVNHEGVAYIDQLFFDRYHPGGVLSK